MKDKAAKKKVAPHPWAELAKSTSFAISELRVLYDHHSTLHRFCGEPEAAAALTACEVAERTEMNTKAVDSESTMSDTTLDLSFEQYCTFLRTLIEYGSPSQQFEYVFQSYAVESERGISRGELFKMLQDHFRPSTPVATDAASRSRSSGVPLGAVDTRYFERLYTWLKKHFILHDKARCGFLTLPMTVEMLLMHPDAHARFQIQISPLIAKLEENNKSYQAKAKAAAIDI